MPLDPVPPVPIAATYDVLLDKLIVTFDRTLVPQAVTAGTITFRVSGNLRRAINIAAAGTTVADDSVFVVASPGADVVNYAPPPFDILDLITGAPAVAFADFPLTLL